MGYVAALLKGFRWVLVVYSAISMVVVPLTSSLSACVKGEGCEGLWTNTGGIIFAQSVIIQDSIDKLTDEEARAKYPEKYDADYIDYLKTKILGGLVIKGAWIIILYLLFRWIGGSANDDLLHQVIYIIFAILATEFMAAIYSIFIRQPTYPFFWLWSLIKNWDFVFASGPAVTFDMLKASLNATQTAANSTLTNTTVV